MGCARRLISSLTLALALSACRKAAVSSTKAADGADAAGRPSLTMERMSVESYGAPGLEWKLTAPLGEMFSPENIMRVRNFSVDLFQKKERSSRINADEGIMNTAPENGKTFPVNSGVTLLPGDMYLNGHVVMISTDGSTLNTDWAYYSQKTNLITSTAPVQVTRHDSVTNGMGLEATADLTQIKIFNETLVINESTPTNENK